MFRCDDQQTLDYLERDDLFTWLDRLKTDFDVVVPVTQGSNRSFQPYPASKENIVIGEARTAEPIKGFFTKPREKVAELFKAEIPVPPDKPYVIVGAKACDLQGFFIQDHVFLNKGRKDPIYQRAREQNLIISTDCSLALDTCFCLALGHQPYPEKYFDINLSEVTDGYVVEVGSAKGQAMLEHHQTLFQALPESIRKERQQRRQQIVADVETKIGQHNVPYQNQYEDMIERNYDSEIWQDEAERCVECGACNTICPTCHCFCLSDQKIGDSIVRFREWDSCLLKGFSQVAGGDNPRAHLWQRLRNRFEKKFDYFPKVAGLNACTGCGRCISACPANIDIRQVLRRLVDNV